ncbi:hypothetical protein BA188_15605 [Aeromonas hydrophila]|nr:hypothetical protein OI72_05505 [Aeromonas hydrophila]OFC44874.1 hypothetical protein BA189_17390 [Aeromonas hydrophila]OFC51574.1 hypothetical protein BA188_15605 [Aeromonas hydrophila]
MQIEGVEIYTAVAAFAILQNRQQATVGASADSVGVLTLAIGIFSQRFADDGLACLTAKEWIISRQITDIAGDADRF